MKIFSSISNPQEGEKQWLSCLLITFLDKNGSSQKLEDEGFSEKCCLQVAVAKSLQSCPTLCNPIDGSPPGSPVHGILQARTLEWVAFPFPMHESEK